MQFIDTMGNISAPVSAGRVRVIAGAPVAVENLTAKVDETGTLITIEWTTPQNAEENMTGARVYVNGALHATVNGTGAKSSTLTVLKLNADGVTSGNPVTGINRYDISIYGYNDAGNAAAETLSVWNVPDMEVSSGQGTVIINEQLTMNNEQLMEIFENPAFTNIVLTSGITLSGWTPVDISGKNFYGNGRTVTVNGFNNATTGYVEGDPNFTGNTYHYSEQGASIIEGDVLDELFWTRRLEFNSPVAEANTWTFIRGMRHPLLLLPDGTLMAGQ